MTVEEELKWKNRLVDYFVVCGLGLDLQSLNDDRGYQGRNVRYIPSLLDHYPPKEHANFEIPPLLATAVLPCGLTFYEKRPYASQEESQSSSYPIILTDSDGTKIYVAVVSFRDRVDEDIAQAYAIPPNTLVDKAICLVSHWPYLDTFRECLEEIHRSCFSASGCSKPIWDTVAHLVTGVPPPTVGRSLVMFTVENSLLSVAALPNANTCLPYTEISFRPLVECLDVDNLIRLVTAVALEKRILLRAAKYELLTSVAEASTHLVYPFRWLLPYVPVVPAKLLGLFDAPGSTFFGLCTSLMDNVSPHNFVDMVLVDLDNNRIQILAPMDPHEPLGDLPALPEPELSIMRNGILNLVHPSLQQMDQPRYTRGGSYTKKMHNLSKPWSKLHDQELRLIFLKFFASALNGYRNFVDYSGQESTTGRPRVVFSRDAYLKKRIRSTPRPTANGEEAQREEEVPDLSFIYHLCNTLGWSFFLEDGLGSAGAGPNLFDNACEACGRGKEVRLPPIEIPSEIYTVPEAAVEAEDRQVGRSTYDRFPSSEKTPDEIAKREKVLQEVEGSRKRPTRMSTVASSHLEDTLRKSILERSNTSFISRKAQEREKEREAMVADIKLKLSRLWDEFLRKPLEEEPLEEGSYYGTIYVMLESDAEGIAGIGFMECIAEHIAKGWDCRLGPVHFTAVRDLVLLAVSRAASRSNTPTIVQALEVSARLYRRDDAEICDFIQRHIGALSIWQDFRFWDYYFNVLMEQYTLHEGNHANIVLEQLMVLAHHMAELGLVDADAWGLLEALANREKISVLKQIRLRGRLAQAQQNLKYFAPSPHSPQATLWQNPASKTDPSPRGTVADNGTETMSGSVGRSWMPAWMGATKGGAVSAGPEPPGRNRRTPSWSGPDYGMDGNDMRAEAVRPSTAGRAAGHQKGFPGMRVLRGHTQAITALHAGTKSDLGDLLADGDDVGYFASGSFDKTVKLWDPSMRGQELRATMEGHQGAVRCISSDRTRIISGGDDKRIFVFDKATAKPVVELQGHEDSVTCVRMLSGLSRGSVLTAGRDGQVKMWDTRAGRDQVATTVAKWPTSVLCIDYLDHAYMLGAAGTDSCCHVWDVRAGKERYKLQGHSNWIRSVRMVGDAVVTGSDDWTARVWTLNDGQCEAVLACHAGPITAVEYSQAARGLLVTGSADHTVRLWDRAEGSLRCVETVGIHNSTILSVKAGERWLAIAAADNSMSLFHRPQAEGYGEKGRQSMAGWELFKSMNRAPDLIRHVACDVDRGRICSGSRSGILRVWEAPQLTQTPPP